MVYTALEMISSDDHQGLSRKLLEIRQSICAPTKIDTINWCFRMWDCEATYVPTCILLILMIIDDH